MYITAWRVWRLLKQGEAWFLASVHRAAVWQGPLMTACCEPKLDNRHGLYSCRSRDMAEQYRLTCGCTTCIVGEVRLLGKSVEWTDGWQSYQQMVLSLSLGSTAIPRVGSGLLTRLAFFPVQRCFDYLYGDCAMPLPDGRHNSVEDPDTVAYAARLGALAFVSPSNRSWEDHYKYERQNVLGRKEFHRVAAALSSRYDVDCSVEVE